ncbi:aryl-alcohol dehydrogenase-like predicted oxidoreductase [Amycolatopsis bartoniae]|uniref:Oxidoreductase n=1 Tax=Amycolatopsis bartoniae TaxID=941986 RepID=A0A8H9IXX7_9PSEU|nr:aldo/keto reductase [Amycolatopsis bartoniae]MBB2939846.1 aryl-alcohol dehydrogenase-like predicted oxidoreductase [Amycolatopsis bartoniae]TVT07452.1 aldo/keto reductase [Amycolatopsis bartoniae]GHF54910.1 oxidoreductase [Amycolatopsis bartoniae]
MRYQTFGRQSGLRVSEYVLGTANFGSAPAAAGLAGAKAIFEAFVAAGGTTFDVSNVYHNGEAETVLGDLLGRERDEFVVITKYTGSRQARIRPGTTGNSRKTMIRSLEESLRRLKTDYVDVFMPHLPDGVTPMPEILAGLADLVQAGKIRYAGLSNFPAWRVAGAAVRSELSGHAPLAGIQTEYSLAERSADRELLPMAQAHGLGVVLYSPLAGGLLTGKYRRGGQGRLSARAATTAVESGQRTAVLDAVLAVAEETGTGPVQVALAWLRRRAARATTSMIPVVGPRTPAHLEGYLDALDVELNEEHYRLLDEASAIRLGTPHEDVAAALAHGIDGDRSLLDAPIVPVI